MNNLIRPMTEQKVLKKLQIEDFRHLTKDKVISMATMLDKMDPEVAKKALEQFPNFSSTMKEILSEYKQSLDKALESNNESVKSYYDTCDVLIASCQNILEQDNLSFEQKKEVIDIMIDITKMKGDKDSENKKFIISMAVTGCVALGSVALALLAALGGNSNVELDD